MMSTAAIEMCWPTIETFIDLESAISLSSTCRSLHSLIIDVATHKAKVTHFQVCNLPPPDNNDISVIGIPRDYTTAHIRIPHYVSHALSHIHFPSLSKLHLDFPLTRKRHATGDAHSDYIEDVHTSAFPILASQLGAHACNKLTSLYLNCNRLLQYERGGCLDTTYEIFGQSLSRCCTELEELSIVNTGIVRGENTPMYSVGLASALVSTLKRRKDMIRKFDYEVYGRPLLFNRFGEGANTDIIRKTNCDVFSAVLQSTKLEQLCIKCSAGPYRDLVRAATICKAENGSREKKSSSIRDLSILCLETRVCNGNYIMPPVGPLLDHFSDCKCLQTLYLTLPKPCWRESQTLEALTNLLTNKPELLRVGLSFSGLDDREGKVLEYLSGILAQLALGSVNIFDFGGLLNVDEARLLKLIQGMEKLGFDVRRNRLHAAIRFQRSERRE